MILAILSDLADISWAAISMGIVLYLAVGEFQIPFWSPQRLMDVVWLWFGATFISGFLTYQVAGLEEVTAQPLTVLIAIGLSYLGLCVLNGRLKSD